MRLLSLVAVAWIVAPLQGAETVCDPRHCPVPQCPVTFSFISYPVSGSSDEELRTELIKNGPRDKLGKARFAFADWHITWRWGLDGVGNVLPDTIKLSCQVEITLPRLVPTKQTSPELVKRWYDFVGRVRQHELNHARHAQERAWLIRERISEAQRRVGPLSPAAANKIAGRVLDEIQALDYAYDLSTEHGKSEGAWRL
jgi:predicted secreted Zn-dependent protease